MPQPPKSADDKLEYGVTVLFNKADHELISRLAAIEHVSKGKIVRRLFHKGLRSERD